MKHVGRPLSAAAATIGLALVLTGCADNVIGADGPQPGIAAQVEDAEITLDDLTSVVDGLCTLQEADERAAPTSREYAQAQILQAWVTALVDAEFADDQQIDATRAGPRPRALARLGRRRRGRPRPVAVLRRRVRLLVRCPPGGPGRDPRPGRLRHHDQPPVRHQARGHRVRSRRRAALGARERRGGHGDRGADTRGAGGPPRRRAVREATRRRGRVRPAAADAHPAMESPADDALAEFVAVMRRLRAECPWKQEQTHRSLARYLLEETHETLEAIDSGDMAHLREELGDLLLQVVFHAVIAEQAGEFDLDDVARDITDKMRRRNPHVYGRRRSRARSAASRPHRRVGHRGLGADQGHREGSRPRHRRAAARAAGTALRRQGARPARAADRDALVSRLAARRTSTSGGHRRPAARPRRRVARTRPRPGAGAARRRTTPALTFSNPDWAILLRRRSAARTI